MSENLVEYLEKIITPSIVKTDIATKFLKRASEGKPTKDENKESHFCIYFAAFDPIVKEVFLGHHIKSGLWLFNGGHIDPGETPLQALKREIGEEWGIPMDIEAIGNPALLTITPINNPTKQLCKLHYDIWYLVRVNKSEFNPDQTKLDKEFHQTKWLDTENARLLVKEDKNTLQAIGVIESKFR